MKQYIIILMSILFAFTSCSKQKDTPDFIADNIKNAVRIELKPSNLFLIADGKATMDLTPKIIVSFNGKEFNMLNDRIKEDELIYESKEIKNIKKQFSTADKSLINKTISVRVSLKSRPDLVSNWVKFTIIDNKAKDLPIIEYPIVFHLVCEKGQEERTGFKYPYEYFQEAVNRLNNVFAGKVSNAPTGADSKIRFVMANYDPEGNKMEEPGLHRVYFEEGSFKNLNILTAFKEYNKYNCIWNADKYLNIILDNNDIIDANTIVMPLCYPLYEGEKAIEGIQSGNPFLNVLNNIDKCVWYKAPQLKQINKEYESGMLRDPGVCNIAYYIGIYFGLIPNNSYGYNPVLNQPLPNTDGITYCNDVPTYHKDNKFYKSNTTPIKENDSCFWISSNIMDDATGYHTSISPDQALRMRWVMENCPNRGAYKK